MFIPKLLNYATLSEELTNYSTISKIRLNRKNSYSININDDLVLDKIQDVLFERMLYKFISNLNLQFDFSNIITNNQDNLKTYKMIKK